MPAAKDPSAKTPAARLADDNAGHRERLRERLITGGADGLLDHEIIEFLLTLTLPRVDTKPIAKRLLNHFGNFGALMAADVEALKAIEGMGPRAATAIKIVQVACLRLLQSEAKARPVLGNWQALLDYLRADMAHMIHERFRVLHLDTQNGLIFDDAMSEGTVDETAVHVRSIIKRALDLGSAALILVHNHPGGDPSPSRQDIRITREIAETCARLNISLHDHIIVGRNGHSSFKALGLI